MFQRHSFLVMALFTALLVGAGTTLSQTGSSESASQLLSQGNEAYQKGDLQAARETLKRVDPVQLDRPQRVQLSKLLKDIDAKLSGQAAEATAAAPAPAAASEATPAAAPNAAPAAAVAAGGTAAVVAAGPTVDPEEKAKAASAAKAAATAAAAKAGAEAQAKADAEKAAADKAAAEAQAAADAEKAAADAAAKSSSASSSGGGGGGVVAGAAAGAVAGAAVASGSDDSAEKAAAERAAAEKSAAAEKAKAGSVTAAVTAQKTADEKKIADDNAAAQKAAADAAAAEKLAADEKKAADEKLAAEQKAAAEEAALLTKAAEDKAKAAEAARLAAVAAATQAKADADAKSAAAIAAQVKADEAKLAAETAAATDDQAKADSAKAAAAAAAAAAVAAKADATKAADTQAVAEANVTKTTEEAEKAKQTLMQLAISLRSQEQVANGKRFQANDQLPEALAAYKDALALDPSNKDIQALIDGVEARRANTSAPSSLLSENVTSNVVRADAAVLDINTQLGLADDLRKKGQFAAARNSVSQASNVLQQNQKAIQPDRAAALKSRIEAMDAQIAAEETSSNLVSAEQAKLEDKQLQEQKKQALARQKDEEVQNLLRRVQELRKEQKYDEALRLVNQILFIKENDPAALFIKEMIEEARIITIYAKHQQSRSKFIAEHSALNIEATMPYTALLTYPPDWPQLTERRFRNKNKDAGDSIANIRVREKLDEPLDTVDFQAFRLSTVIDYMRRITALNFDVNWPALEEVGVAKDTPVTLQLNNVPAREVLRLVLAQISPPGDSLNPVSFAVINGIVRISTQRVLNKDLDTKMYDIRDLLHEVASPNAASLPTFDLSSALSSSSGSVQSSGSSAFGSGSTSGQSSIFPSTSTTGAAGPDLLTRIQDLIRQTVGNPEDWDTAGGTVSSMREINGNLIIKTTPQYQREIARLLASLRETRAHQITVEARFLLVDQNFLEEVGVDIDVQFNPNSTNWSPIKVAQDSWSLAQRGSTGLPGSFGSQATQPPPIPNFTPGVGFTPSGRSFDFGVSYLDDVQVNLLIRATQANRRSISLTAPRVTFMNGQAAYVAVAKQISFISALEPVPDAAGFNPELSVISSGVLLAVRGTITDDRRYVTLTLNPSLSTVTQPIRTIPQIASVTPTTATTTTTTAGTTGTQIISAYIEAPEVDVTQIETTVTVPDKGTLLLGGQRLVGENEVEAGVPILSKIPIINRLFTNRSTIKDERTLLILVKPTIIITDEEEEELYPGLLERYDRGRGVSSGPRSANIGMN